VSAGDRAGAAPWGNGFEKRSLSMSQRIVTKQVEVRNGYLAFSHPGGTAPDPARPGESRLYYDTLAGQLKISVEGSAYTPLAGSANYDANVPDGTAYLTMGGGSHVIGAGGTYLSISDDSGQSTYDFLRFHSDGTRVFRVASGGTTEIAGAVTIGAATAATPLRAGRGLALGAPAAAPTPSTNGAGVLNGTYAYAYSETASTGESSLSPEAQVVATNNTVRVVVPYARSGTSSRKLYRRKLPSTTFRLVHDFGGAGGYHQSTWDDNTADGAEGAAHSGADSSILYECEVNQDVKFWRTHPDRAGNPHDVTLLTSDPQTGSYSQDAYGPIFCRTRIGNSFGSQKTGTTGTHFYAEWLDDVDTGAAGTNVFNVFARGEVQMVPLQLTESRPALAITTTMPSVLTANRFAVTLGVTGAGSSAFEQQGFRVDWAAGYTGSSPVRGIASQMSSAHSGSAYAVWGSATGAATRCFGVVGNAASGTGLNMGGFFGLGQAPDGLTASCALGASNGATTSDILRCWDAGSAVFLVRDGGMTNFAAITHPLGGQLNSGDFWRESARNAWQCFVGSTVHTVPMVLFTQTASQTVANSTTETTLFSTGVGQRTLGQFGGNYLVAGKTIRVYASGFLSITGTPNLTFRLKLGGATVATSGAVANAAVTDTGWEFWGTITCRTTGVTGSVFAQGHLRYGTAGATNWKIIAVLATAATTIDTTAQQAIDLTVQWGTADAGNTITATNAAIEALN